MGCGRCGRFLTGNCFCHQQKIGGVGGHRLRGTWAPSEPQPPTPTTCNTPPHLLAAVWEQGAHEEAEGRLSPGEDGLATIRHMHLGEVHAAPLHNTTGNKLHVRMLLRMAVGGEEWVGIAPIDS